MSVAAFQATQAQVRTMDVKCEVIGWLLVEDDRAHVMIREASGRISLQRADSESAFGHHAVQTGTFRRGNAILDPVTREVLGYEMEQLPSPIGALV